MTRQLLATALVWMAMGMFFLYFAHFALRLYDNYLMKALDLGNMDQAVWNTAQGRPFVFTNMRLPLQLEAFGTTSRLSFHIEPILLPIAALYRVIAGPPVLLILQVLVVALAALPLSWLARDLLRSRMAGVVFPLVYLDHPMLQSATLDEFHPVTLAPTFLLFALWYAYRRSYRWFILYAVLAICCKEEIGLLISVMGVALAIRRRSEPAARAAGLGMAAAAIGWSAFAFKIVIPWASLGKPSPYWARLLYDSPPNGAMVTAVTVLRFWHDHPGELLHTIALPAKRLFVWNLLAPVGFLAVLALDILCLAAPSLVLILVTHEFHMFSGIGHYTAELMPFITLAAIVAVRRTTRLLQMCLGPSSTWATGACYAVLLGATALGQIANGFTPLHAAMAPPPISAHARIAQQMLTIIPSQAAVSAQEGLNPHLSERQHIYLFPDLGPHQVAEYIALDVTAGQFPQSAGDVYNQVQLLLASGRWGIRFAQDGLLLLQRGAHQTRLSPLFLSYTGLRNTKPSRPSLARFDNVLDLIDYRLTYRAVQYLGYPVLEVATRWRVRSKVPANVQMGNYYSISKGPIVAAWADQPTLRWFPPSRWRPGDTFWVQMQPFVVPLDQQGSVGVDVAIFQGQQSDKLTPGRRLPITLLPSDHGRFTVGQAGTLLRLANMPTGY